MDVSVGQISSLYDYCHSAEAFLSAVETAISRIKSELDLLLADTYTNINRIQDVLDRSQADVDDIKAQINDLRDQMRGEEDPEVRKEMSEELQSLREDLSEAKEEARQCEDDMNHAEALRREIISRVSTLEGELDNLSNSVTLKLGASTDFIRKYASYLQNATATN